MKRLQGIPKESPMLMLRTWLRSVPVVEHKHNYECYFCVIDSLKPGIRSL